MSFLNSFFNKKELNSDMNSKEKELGLYEAEIESTEQFDSEEDNQLEEAFDVEEKDGKEYEVVEREILPAKIICPDCGG
ncbi:MAG: hypothetical protein WBI07_22390, partial [Mobilitalea sp.]